MIETHPPGTLESGKPILRPFTGKPVFRQTAEPSNPVRVVKGKMKRSEYAVDYMLFGVAPFVAPTLGLYRRFIE